MGRRHCAHDSKAPHFWDAGYCSSAFRPVPVCISTVSMNSVCNRNTLFFKQRQRVRYPSCPSASPHADPRQPASSPCSRLSPGTVASGWGLRWPPRGALQLGQRSTVAFRRELGGLTVSCAAGLCFRKAPGTADGRPELRPPAWVQEPALRAALDQV